MVRISSATRISQDRRMFQPGRLFRGATMKQKTKYPPRGRISQQLGRKPSVYYLREKARIDSINKEIELFNKGLTFGNYKQRYDNSSPAAKKLLKTPSEFFASNPNYKKYIANQNQIQYNNAYNQVVKHYKKGMLWAVAAYGSGLQRTIAKKMIKDGVNPARGGLLDQQRQKEQNEILKKTKTNTTTITNPIFTPTGITGFNGNSSINRTSNKVFTPTNSTNKTKSRYPWFF